MRRGFTLVEIIVSVVLLFLLVFFLTANQKTLRQAAEQSKKYEQIEGEAADFAELLTADILQARLTQIAHGRDYDALYLYDTRSSLYARGLASVAYVVLKPSRFLLRVEGRLPFRIPLAGPIAYRYNFLPFSTPLKSFKTYKSRKTAAADNNLSASCTLLLFIEPDEGEPKIMEFGLLNTTACD